MFELQTQRVNLLSWPLSPEGRLHWRLGGILRTGQRWAGAADCWEGLTWVICRKALCPMETALPPDVHWVLCHELYVVEGMFTPETRGF